MAALGFPHVDVSPAAHLVMLLHNLKFPSQRVVGLLLSAPAAAGGAAAPLISTAWPLFHGPLTGPLFEMALHTSLLLAQQRDLSILGLYQTPAPEAAQAPASLDPATSLLLCSLPCASPLLIHFVAPRKAAKDEAALSATSFYSCFAPSIKNKSAGPLKREVLVSLSEPTHAIHGQLLATDTDPSILVQAIFKVSDFTDHLHEPTRDFTNTALITQLLELLR
ncbi:MAG: hypothetical protein Q8P67_26995 [archaeon]|nr:hypothetical protein [archaeon]